MRNYLIIVEGAHDIAVIEKVLQLNGVTDRIKNEAELPDVWKRTIPSSFPFHDGRLERITPIPSFVRNQDVSIAIKNANSDIEIMPVLQQLMDSMLFSEKDQIDAVMLICDADRKNAEQKRLEMLSSYEEKKDFKIVTEDKQNILDLQVKQIPLYVYVFPDNENDGNLENLLLETAQIVYPELLKLAEDFVLQASETQNKLKKEQYAKKAKVGCIANAMKPGKANQVSIADDEWICEETLKECEMLRRLNAQICEMIGI